MGDDPVWDVVVIGAGPAGCLAARELSRLGRRVLLLERKAFPRYKVCGACLSHAALEQLADVGLAHDVLRLNGQVLNEVCFQHGGRGLTLPVPAGLAVARSRFDETLANAAIAAGATFWQQTKGTIQTCDLQAESRRIDLESSLSRPESVMARVVLSADGLTRTSLQCLPEFQSHVASSSRIGVGLTLPDESPHYSPGRICLAVEREGYVGVVRTEQNELNLAAALSPGALDDGPATAVTAILNRSGYPVPDALGSHGWQGTVPLTRSSVAVAGQRVLLLGDSTGYVEPFTGEGMAWAIQAGLAAARLVHSALADWSSATERRWTQLVRTELRPGQTWCRILSGLVRQSWALGPVLSLLNFAPFLARPIVRRVSTRVSHVRSGRP